MSFLPIKQSFVPCLSEEQYWLWSSMLRLRCVCVESGVARARDLPSLLREGRWAENGEEKKLENHNSGRHTKKLIQRALTSQNTVEH